MAQVDFVPEELRQSFLKDAVIIGKEYDEITQLSCRGEANYVVIFSI